MEALLEIVGILECPHPELAHDLRRAMADDADLQALSEARDILEHISASAARASSQCLSAIINRIGPAIEAADLEREKRTNPLWQTVRDRPPLWPASEDAA